MLGRASSQAPVPHLNKSLADLIKHSSITSFFTGMVTINFHGLFILEMLLVQSC